MEELIAELKKLGATVKDWFGGVNVNGVDVCVDVSRRNDKVQYEIGDKKSTSTKNTAYYILSERVPELIKNEEFEKLIDHLSEGIDGHTISQRFGGVFIRTKDPEEFKKIIRHMADRLN